MWDSYILLFAASVMPITVFVGSLVQQACGRAATFSPITCYLGLLLAGIFTICMPMLLVHFGFWPIVV